MSQLPPWAVELLKNAALTTNTDKNPNARAKAVDRVIQHLRTRIPEHFKEDAHVPSNRDK